MLRSSHFRSTACHADGGAPWLCAAVLTLFAAFLVKETAIWAAPIGVYAVVCDVRADGWKQVARVYAPVAGLGVCLLIAYLAWCAHVWDDPLARFRGIDALTHEHAWTLEGHSTRAWIARLTWQPLLLLGSMFFVGLAALVAGHWLVDGRERIWLVSAWIFVLLYWFGSASLSSYSPLPLSERMALPILPPLLVTVAITLDRIQSSALRVALVCSLVAPGLLQVSRNMRRMQPETEAFAVLRREVAQHASTRFVRLRSDIDGPRMVSRLAAIYRARDSCVRAFGLDGDLTKPTHLTNSSTCMISTICLYCMS